VLAIVHGQLQHMFVEQLIWALHYSALPMTINYSIFLLCFHMVFNNSSLFMSMSDLIYINIIFMKMKRHILIGFFRIQVGG